MIRKPVLLAVLLLGLAACGEDERAGVVTERDVDDPRGSLVVVGDSLAVGAAPYLPDALARWSIRTNALGGRTLEEGMDILADQDVDDGDVVAISLFTNNNPADVASLVQAVRTSASRARCVVWSTIVAPGVGGTSFRTANAALRRLDAELGDRMELVRWDEHVAAVPDHLSYDEVHATEPGYRARARLYADAVERC